MALRRGRKNFISSCARDPDHMGRPMGQVISVGALYSDSRGQCEGWSFKLLCTYIIAIKFGLGQAISIRYIGTLLAGWGAGLAG
jgi:hypothetical protein